MRKNALFYLVLCSLIFSILPIHVFAEDDIPDNCEYQYGAYYRQNVFPRYEPQNRRLMLVDWTTGADVGVLAADLNDTLIGAWSGDCRYLTVSTGSVESRDTLVYDTVDLRYIGSVPDARLIPHPITWGPSNFLMVETRNGAILWNVPQNIQYPLDVGFNEITGHNFRRLRWDADNFQVTANLANGGRAVFDMNTGQPTILASSGQGEIVLGGERFQCIPRRNGRGGANAGQLSLSYALDGQVVYLGKGWSGEAFATIEAGLPPISSNMGWSANCRYIAGALMSTEREDTYDTYIWDVLEGRRVGVFADARDLSHQLTWDTAEKQALVETRNGAYLWNLVTDERILVNSEVQEPSFNCQYEECQTYSFERVYWDAGRQQMLGVPVQSPNAVVAYDVNTGQEVARYTVEGASEPLDFITSNDSRLLVTYADNRVTIWNRDTGSVTSFGVFPFNSYYSFFNRAAISTDNHFLAIAEGNTQLWVWDLTSLNSEASPTYTYKLPAFGYWWNSSMYFVNSDTLDAGNPYRKLRLNVVTGEQFMDVDASINPLDQSVQNFTALDGTNGYGVYHSANVPNCLLTARYDLENRQLIVRDMQTDTERVIEADLNRMNTLYLSPDCTTVYGEFRVLNTSLPYDETPAEEPYSYFRRNTLIFWNLDTRERLLSMEVGLSSKHRGAGAIVWWNPDGDRAFIDPGTGSYALIHTTSRSVVPVIFQDTEIGWLPSQLDTYWDHNRGLVMVSGFGEVFAIDMQTGQERLRFPALEDQRGGCAYSSSTGCGMELSPDGNWVFIYGNTRFSAWNVDTLAHATVPVESTGGAIGQPLVSPDGRYLVLSRSAVRVWDLTTLAADFEARLPIATYGVGDNAVLSVNFADNATLEVITRSADGTATILYDLVTGTPR